MVGGNIGLLQLQGFRGPGRPSRMGMSMKRILFPLVLLATFSSAVAGTGETGFQGYTEQVWSAQDGLANQAIQALAQTADGSLWIGTKGGLLQFDGALFVRYDRETGPAALERGVNALYAARDGSLWIGTEGGGLLRYRDQQFRSYAVAGKPANEFIRAVYEDSVGNVWVGSDQGLFRVTGSALTRIDGKDGTPTIFVRSIAEDLQGRIWVAGTSLLEFHGMTFVRAHPLPGGPSRNLVASVLAARDGTLWAGTLSGLWHLTASGTLQPLAGVSAPVTILGENADGTLWAGTIGQGLFIYRQGRLLHIDPSRLPSKTVKAVLEDRERNVWLGTRSGIVRLSRTPVSIVPFPGGADSESETLYRDLDGSVWVAASTRLFHIRNGVAVPYSFPGQAGLRVRTLFRDHEGNLWIGTDGSGLLCLQRGRVLRYTSQHGLINDFVRVILQGRDGTIWVGTDGGVTHIESGNLENFDTTNGLAYFSITALCEDREGDVWVGTSRGLSHLSRGIYVHDAATAALSQEQLWSIVQDDSGELWFGTSSGLYGFKAGKLVHLTTAEGLANNTVYQILDDTRGYVWLSSSNSISRLKAGDLDAFARGALQKVHLSLYVGSHDLGSASLYSGMQPEGATTPQGDVWFPASSGAIHVAVDRIQPEIRSAVRIDQISADGQLLAPDRKAVLKAGNGRLEISYGAIRLRSQEGLRYRYRMEGLESWNYASSRRTAYYTHLPPGKYIFRVEAFAVDDPDVVSEASIPIEQKPHFYATPWFVGCCILALLAVVFLLYRMRLRQMRMRFQAVNEERTRLAREMHDTVIQGCVGVSTLLEAALGVESSEEPLRQQLLSFATDQVRTTIETAREAVWALRNPSAPAMDIGSLCEEIARQVQLESGITIACSVAGTSFDMGELATHEVMMTAREALSNAVTHANPNKVEISISFSEHDLRMQIRDDGCGFDPNLTSPQNGHYGVLGMRERVELLGGKLTIASSAAQGTAVKFSVPRRRAGRERMIENDTRAVSQRN